MVFSWHASFESMLPDARGLPQAGYGEFQVPDLEAKAKTASRKAAKHNLLLEKGVFAFLCVFA
jgi:hypothetical protein